MGENRSNRMLFDRVKCSNIIYIFKNKQKIVFNLSIKRNLYKIDDGVLFLTLYSIFI